MVAEHRTVCGGVGDGSRRGRDRVAGVAEATRIREHRIWLEDGLVLARMDGPFTGADAPPFHAFLERVFAASGPVFLLSDMTELKGVDADARRYMASWHAQERRIGAIAMVGAGTVGRVVATLLVKAIQVIKNRPVAPVGFFKDEAEARRWLTARRAEGSA